MASSGTTPFRVNMTEARHALAETLWSLLSRLLTFPFTLVIRRDPAHWVVIGREHGLYLDNAKYFHAWLHANLPTGHELHFLSEDGNTLRRLRDANVKVTRYPSFHAFSRLLRAGTIVVDSADYIEHGRVGFLRGARIVQLWHGAPLKEIELALHRRRLARLARVKRGVLAVQKWALRRYAPCDVLVSTSEYFTKRAFSTCFAAKRTAVTGYPRNDAIEGGDDYSSRLVNMNVDSNAMEKLRSYRSRGNRVVLYAPTFRHDRKSAFACGAVSLNRLSRFARANNASIVLKLHPLMASHYSSERHDGIVDIDSRSDIYPLLKFVDVLVTDYSSIYFDFLLLDRPLVFYPYDYAAYVTTDRHLLFDYWDMTPGPKVGDMDQLLAELARALKPGPDKWRAERTRVRRLAFDHTDSNASQRLWRVLGQT